jgi:transposase-like protein
MAEETQTPIPAANATRKTPRVPPAVRGINVNFCKNPACGNFGIPVPETGQKGPGAQNEYTIVANGAGIPAARCNHCGETFTLKSNQGVFEEAYRLLSKHHMASSCPDQSCVNHRVPTTVPGAYHSFGFTNAGSPRYRCKADGCGKTFTVKANGRNPIARQIQSDKNRLILSMLVGKMPLRRIMEAADVAAPVLYERIDFLHEQAQALPRGIPRTHRAWHL